MSKSTEDDLRAEIAELRQRVSGLEDLVFSISNHLKGYIENVAHAPAGKIGRPSRIVTGSPDLTEKQSNILDAVSDKGQRWGPSQNGA